MRLEGLAMKNSNDTIGNRTGDRVFRSAVPQPTALPRAPKICLNKTYILSYLTDSTLLFH